MLRIYLSHGGIICVFKRINVVACVYFHFCWQRRIAELVMSNGMGRKRRTDKMTKLPNVKMTQQNHPNDYRCVCSRNVSTKIATSFQLHTFKWTTERMPFKFVPILPLVFSSTRAPPHLLCHPLIHCARNLQIEFISFNFSLSPASFLLHFFFLLFPPFESTILIHCDPQCSTIWLKTFKLSSEAHFRWNQL